MKKITILLLAVCTVLTTNIMAQSEFSSNLIGVGVLTADLEASLDFYLNVIGMKKTGEFDVNEDLGKSSGLSNGLPFHVDILQLGEDGNVWKLISFGKQAPHAKSTYIQDDIGVQYITINVNNMKPFLERIKKNKVKLLGETPIPLDNGKDQFVVIQAPEGTFIELIGPGE